MRALEKVLHARLQKSKIQRREGRDCAGARNGHGSRGALHNGQFAEIALEGLLTLAVAGVDAKLTNGLVAFMDETLGQLGVQRLLDQQLGQFLEQAALANQVFRLLVVGQQAGHQFFGYFVLLGRHRAYGQAGSRWRWIVRLHQILHTLGA